MSRFKVFFIEETERQKLWLRRFRYSSDAVKCAGPGGYGYCNGMFALGEAPVVRTPNGSHESLDDLKPPADDPRWPTQCDHCGTPFSSRDYFQLHGRTIYRRPDTGAEFLLEDAAPGAVWNAWWIADRREGKQGCAWMVGPDGRALVVRCPDGHDWHIDARAKNCTMPDDNEHFCWVRRGRPEDGTLHVDKNGRTCAAGAGSIATGKWHGFLHNGELYDC